VRSLMISLTIESSARSLASGNRQGDGGRIPFEVVGNMPHMRYASK